MMWPGRQQKRKTRGLVMVFLQPGAALAARGSKEGCHGAV